MDQNLFLTLQEQTGYIVLWDYKNPDKIPTIIDNNKNYKNFIYIYDKSSKVRNNKL